jgi:hypothetical protein
MPRYEPIKTGLPTELSACDLATIHWGTLDTRIDFALFKDERRALQVRFESECIIRVLSEMALSTEEDGAWEGLVPHNFAYRVRDSAFFRTQSDVWKDASDKTAHYRFITIEACVDVISFSAPLFALIGR